MRPKAPLDWTLALASAASIARTRRFWTIVSLTDRRVIGVLRASDPPSFLKFCVRMTSTRSPGERRPVLAPPVTTGIAIARAPGGSTTCRKSRSPGFTISLRRTASPAARGRRNTAPYTRASTSWTISGLASTAVPLGRTISSTCVAVTARHSISWLRNKVPAGSATMAARMWFRGSEASPLRIKLNTANTAIRTVKANRIAIRFLARIRSPPIAKEQGLIKQRHDTRGRYRNTVRDGQPDLRQTPG